MSPVVPPTPPADQPLVLVLLGPTASGKTDLAIALARALDLAVLNVDSRQLYRQMDVGTAKPTAAQRALARHELLDLRDPDQPINLQEFRALAEAQLQAELCRPRASGPSVALLAGGSGLYLQAITQGMEPPAVPPQPQLRAQLAALGQPLCHQLLRQGDPVAAGRIAAADAVRTQRALEVLYATGRPLSSQQGATPPPWRVLELGLQPTDLKTRIASRTRALYDQGLVAETEALMQRYGAELPLLGTIGYAEARQRLSGELSEAEAIALTEQRTRQFAKRQRTWFRRRHQPTWLSGRTTADQLAQALQEVERVLG
ncbi:tRNA (adenosine(37)-N6)-dimethylallyltransferase MiaA [Cyanobium sp. T1B-Tous]|uniref:tRNA (adenosine(37)-N6)-dimethylallyltransferase MiaA n=1 Tax=Cyanobium sp. T1B-Tous TaxID=2823721 RepID=UPI0020CDF249|nr:tRNA (adenosine(37)-N6)-dimethylallyltransferase MiaA [Cyanobium sp. T1B-Tous]MCP9807317.1 tRNA (adenosine(37)-N6)-dimethylallyltransferase MiaA [Cyanobium sp. T1B-Tous]